MKQREVIIEEVGKSITQLGSILAGVQNLGGDETDSSVSDLARVREELDRSLEVARSVERRMQSLEDELRLTTSGGGDLLEKEK